MDPHAPKTVNPTPLRSPAFNVFRIDGTSMRASALLVCKLVWVLSWIEGIPATFALPFVPLWSGLNHLQPWSPLLSQSLLLVWSAAGLLLLWNCWPRACAALLGLILLFSLIADPTHYHNHIFILACTWLLAAASPVDRPPVWFRWQFAIIYLFAAFNKLWEPDWRSGQFFDAWLGQGPAWYAYWSAQLPPGTLGRFVAWSTIAIEAIIGLLFVRPQTLRDGLLLVATFHWLMFLAVPGATFGFFLHHIMLLLLVFVERPPGPWILHLPNPAGRRTGSLLRWIDADGRFHPTSGRERLTLTLSPELVFHGHRAVLAAAFRLPAVIFVVMILCVWLPPLLDVKLRILGLFSIATTVVIMCFNSHPKPAPSTLPPVP